MTLPTIHWVSDISLSSVLLSLVMVIVGGLLWGIGKALLMAIKALIQKLIEVTARVEILDAKMGELTHAVADNQKMRQDMNLFYGRLKTLEDKWAQNEMQSS